MKKALIIVLVIFVLLALAVGGGFLYAKSWYENGLKAVNESGKGKDVEVVNEKRTGTV